MSNYENMTKEELIIEIERLENEMEEVEDFYKIILDQNNKLNDLIKSIQFLLDNSYDNIRSK